jgi:molecular chaperone Hsp33
VKLVSGEIAEDVTRYLLESEQIPSTVGLGVLVNPDQSIAGAAGFLVQAMPDVTEETLMNIERNLSLVSSPSHLAQEGVTAAGIIQLLTVGVESLTLFDAETGKSHPVKHGAG